MKKLIYVLFIIFSSGPLQSQRIPEQPVTLLQPYNKVKTDTRLEMRTPDVFRTCCYCYCGSISYESDISIKRFESTITGTPVDMDAYRTFNIITPQWQPVFIHPNIQVTSVKVRSNTTIYIDGVATTPQIQLEETDTINDDNSCIYLGGIPVRYPDISGLAEKKQQEILFKQQQNISTCICYPTEVINVDLEIINHEELDESIVITDIVPLPDDLVINNEKSTQGPFTGLEGHNFTEDPAIIYPNPVQDILHIKSTDPITVIEILNIHGQVEKSFFIDETMDVSELPAGTYFARIHFENINDVQIEQILIVK